MHGFPPSKHITSGSQRRDDRSTNKDNPLGYEAVGNKIHYSGPLIRPSGNVDQMLKDHNHQIQEVFRMSLDKSKVRKNQGEGNQNNVRPFDLGVVPVSRHSSSIYFQSRPYPAVGFMQM